MKKLPPKPLPHVKTIAIIAGLAIALVSEAFAAPSPTPTPSPTPSNKRGSKLLPPPPNTTPYSG